MTARTWTSASTVRGEVRGLPSANLAAWCLLHWEGQLTGAGIALFAAVFLACAVEAVEAVTIVLAAGTARDWRSAR